MRDALNISKEQGNSCVTMSYLKRIIDSRTKRSLYPDDIFTLSIIYSVLTLMNGVEIFEYNDNIYVYIATLKAEEDVVLKHVRRLCECSKKRIEKADIDDIENSIGIKYNAEQKACFASIETNGLKIITGPPGTGKTMTVKGIIKAYKQAYPKRKIVLGATTGRAAKVLAKACGIRAATVHKILDIKPFGEKIICKNMNHPIGADLLIIDETSMLDLKMTSLLLDAVKTGATVIFIGDEDQLQSVEYGSVLKDLIACQKIEVYRLKQVMRQGGTIYENALRVNSGDFHLANTPDFIVKEYQTQEDALEGFKKDYVGSNSMLLSTVKKGTLGTFNLNKCVQPYSTNTALIYGDTTYHIGDRVIMTHTDYKRGYVNGDIGIIQRKDENGIIVSFDGRIVELSREDYHYMLLAYAITIHKSQGSEFDYIYIFLPDSNKNMLTRRILYTAITRARKKVFIYSVNGSVNLAIDGRREVFRTSLLGLRLADAANVSVAK